MFRNDVQDFIERAKINHANGMAQAHAAYEEAKADFNRRYDSDRNRKAAEAATREQREHEREMLLLRQAHERAMARDAFEAQARREADADARRRAAGGFGQ